MKENNYDLPLQLQITAAALADFDNRILSDSLSIGLAQYKVLASLEGKSPMTQKQIAMKLDQTEASISRQVNGMFEEALVKTEVKPGDKRVHYVVLTPRGRRIKKRAEGLLAKNHKQLFGMISLKQRKVIEAALLELQKQL
ncbi:MarR family transcriptional regulator [Candidatus Saccharibacteria bacterium]|nr:MarR family transcriptional regulator [Candidatus Saccharibacteria bacterium]